MAFNVSLEDSSPLISYEPAGAWSDTLHDSPAISSYSGSSFHTTATPGASLFFSFNGTGVWLYGARMPQYGTYSISIDDRVVIEDNASSSMPAFRQLLGAVTGLEMGLHRVAITNTGSLLDLDYMVFETPTPENVMTSTMTFDDTDSSIRYDSHWTVGNHTGCYNNTIHYTQSPDASLQLSFDGDAIAIYGTVSPSMGNYTVYLDGLEHQLNGGSDGAAGTLHEQTLLYFASNIGARSHNLVITANPSELGDPSFFELDAVSIFSTSGSSTNPSSVPDVSTGAFPTSSTSNSLELLSTSSPLSHLSPATRRSTILTKKPVIAATISAGVICFLGILFFLLFCWKRHRSDPPSYVKVDDNKDNKGLLPSPITPGLPMQDVEKHAGLDGRQDQLPDYRELFSPYASYHESISTRVSSYGSRSSCYETGSNRSTVFSIKSPVWKGHRRNGSDTSVRSESWSTYSSTTIESRRILVNSVLMPPQFRLPQEPLPSVHPLRPSQKRDTVQIPF